MKPATAMMVAAGLVLWLGYWGWSGGEAGATVLLHFPLAGILLAGYLWNLRGGLASSAAAAVLIVVLRAAGVLNDWTLVAWQLLVFGFVGLYPYKFMQIREQRHHHYRTLTEYKRGEIQGLKDRLGELDRKCRELETRLRSAGGSA